MKKPKKSTLKKVNRLLKENPIERGLAKIQTQTVTIINVPCVFSKDDEPRFSIATVLRLEELEKKYAVGVVDFFSGKLISKTC